MPIVFVIAILIILFMFATTMIFSIYSTKKERQCGLIIYLLFVICHAWLVISIYHYNHLEPIKTTQLQVYELDGLQAVLIEPNKILNLTEKYKRHFKDKSLIFNYYPKTCDGIDFLISDYELVEE